MSKLGDSAGDFVSTLAAPEGEATSNNLDELCSNDIAAREGDVISVYSWGDGPTVLQARSESPEKLFAVWGEAALTALPGYTPLIVIPFTVFEYGTVPSQELNPSSEIFWPANEKWEAVPANAQSINDDLVQTVTLRQKRFSRCAPALMEMRRQRKIAQAEQIERSRVVALAERERLAAEKAIADSKREEDRLAAEAAHSEDERRKFEAWLASLPPTLLPDALVLDLSEFNPRVAKVIWPGVFQDKEGLYHHSIPADVLPRRGFIVFGPEAIEVTGQLDPDQPAGGQWFVHQFFLTGLQEDEQRIKAFKEFVSRFVPYVGPPVPVGTRISREKALNGRPDPLPPQYGETFRVGLEFVGRDYNFRVGDQLCADDALDILESKSPDRVMRVYVEHDDDDDDGDDRNRSGGFQYVSQSVSERYADLHWPDGKRRDNLGYHWRQYRWNKQDILLIEQEERDRISRNRDWKRQEVGLRHLLGILGADVSSDCSDVLDDGVSCSLTLTETDLAKLVTFFQREAICRLHVWHERETNRDRVDRCAARVGLVEKLADAWRRSNGSAPRFVGRTQQWAGSRTVQFTIQGLFQDGDVTLFVSPAKMGKSGLLLQAALCVATGEAFIGLEVKQGNAVFLFGEGNGAVMREQLIAARRGDIDGIDLEIIDARHYDPSNMQRALDLALDDIARNPDLRFLVVDAAGAFVSDTSSASSARELVNKLRNVATKAGAAVVLVHHVTKDLTVEKASSAKIVFEKAKGSGEFVNAARGAVTLHQNKGRRVLTLYQHNILVMTTPHLQNAIELEMDAQSGLLRNVNAPVVTVGLGQFANKGANGKAKLLAKEQDYCASDAIAAVGADAHEAAPEIQRLERELGKALPLGGAKCLYTLKARDKLKYWPRARCRAAHERAIELGLCRQRPR